MIVVRFVAPAASTLISPKTNPAAFLSGLVVVILRRLHRAGRMITGKSKGGEIMPNFICTTCGTQYAESDQPPAACAICQDERQYVKATGQQWTTFERLKLTNRNSIRFEEPGLIGIGIDPHFAIGRTVHQGHRRLGTANE